MRINNRLRFAWWSAEELGLLGSTYYVENLPEDELEEIALNLNFDMIGSPNYARFIAVGIPAGGLFTDAEGIKTEEQVAPYGGLAGTAYDPCYHGASDTFDNVSEEGPGEMLCAAANAVSIFARNTMPAPPAVKLTAKAKTGRVGVETDYLGNQLVR